MPQLLSSCPNKITHCLLVVIIFLQGCAVRRGTRPHYSRALGAYTLSGLHPSGALGPVQDLPERGAPLSRLQITADAYLGVPYRRGGMDKSGMDCSGFIKRVYAEALSLDLPHNSSQMGALGKSVSKHKLEKGDILLFGSIFGINHAGIYMGKNRFIHASASKGVMYSSFDEAYFRKKFKGARRILR
ncbi:C40 family peptidase [Fibrobacterota bacterium]